MADEANRYYLKEKVPPKDIKAVEVLNSQPSRPYIVVADFQARNASPEFFCEFDLKPVAQLLLNRPGKAGRYAPAMQYNVTGGPPQDFVFAGLRSPPFGLTGPQAG